MYDYENSPEPELIRRARRGDIKAFSTLYAGIYKDLYRFALCTTRHVQDAEDAVSETVAAAYENIGKLRKEDSFRSWMFTILNNQCRKILRGRNRTVSTDERDDIARDTESAAGHEPYSEDTAAKRSRPCWIRMPRQSVPGRAGRLGRCGRFLRKRIFEKGMEESGKGEQYG